MNRSKSIYNVENRMARNFANAIGGGYKFSNYSWNKSAAYANANGAGMDPRMAPLYSGEQLLPPNERTQGIQVVNANTASALTVTLFNGFADPTDANLNASLTITTRNAPSHTFLKYQTNSNPFIILGAKYVVTTAAQLNNPWTYQVQDATGFTGSYIINPTDFASANNQQTLRVDMADVALRLDGRGSLAVSVNASETINFVFYVKGRIVLGNVAQGQSVKEATDAPPPTGNFAFDFQQQGEAFPAGFSQFSRRRLL